jgi:F-type H+-transporting ATPase subunit epsilon
MADTLQFDLVAPERKLASVAATEVVIPGMNGDFTAKPNHAPFLTTLRPGIVRVSAEGAATEFVVIGGFAEVSATAAIVLAEQAVPRDEANAAMLDELVLASERALAEAPEEGRLAAGQRLRDAGALRAVLKL